MTIPSISQPFHSNVSPSVAEHDLFNINDLLSPFTLDLCILIKEKLGISAGKPLPTENIFFDAAFIRKLKIDFTNINLQDKDICQLEENLRQSYVLFTVPDLPPGIVEKNYWSPTPLLRFLMDRLPSKKDVNYFFRIFVAFEKENIMSENDVNRLIDEMQMPAPEINHVEIADHKMIQAYIEEELELYFVRLTDFHQKINAPQLLGKEFESDLLKRVKEFYPFYKGSVDDIHQSFLKKIKSPYLLKGALNFPMLIKENCSRFIALKPVDFANIINNWIYAVQNVKINIVLLTDYIKFILRNYPTQNIDLTLLDITILVTIEAIESMDTTLEHDELTKFVILLIEKANDGSSVLSFEHSVVNFIEQAFPIERACKILESRTFLDDLTKLHNASNNCRYSGPAHLSCMVDLWVSHPPLYEYWKETLFNPTLININITNKVIKDICLKLIRQRGFFYLIESEVHTEYRKLLPMIPYDHEDAIKIFAEVRREWLTSGEKAGKAPQEQREYSDTAPS